MADMFNDVQAMHIHFEIPTPVIPTALTKDVLEFRIKAMREEIQEFEDADNLADQVDALVDLVVFALGTADLMGIFWQVHWREVMEKNMQKERVKDASESKRGHSLDLKKPEGWTPPDHNKVFNSFYYDQEDSNDSE